MKQEIHWLAFLVMAGVGFLLKFPYDLFQAMMVGIFSRQPFLFVRGLYADRWLTLFFVIATPILLTILIDTIKDGYYNDKNNYALKIFLPIIIFCSTFCCYTTPKGIYVQRLVLVQFVNWDQVQRIELKLSWRNKGVLDYVAITNQKQRISLGVGRKIGELKELDEFLIKRKMKFEVKYYDVSLEQHLPFLKPWELELLKRHQKIPE